MEFFNNLLRKLRVSKTREMKEEPKTTDVPYEQDIIRETMKKWKEGAGPIATTWHRGYMGGVHYTNPPSRGDSVRDKLRAQGIKEVDIQYAIDNVRDNEDV